MTYCKRKDCIHYDVCAYKACKFVCPYYACNTYDRPQGEWGKWIIAEIQCPNCFKYFETDYYSTGELNKCPNCGAEMKGGVN